MAGLTILLIPCTRWPKQ